jgi:hypothetical protein
MTMTALLQFYAPLAGLLALAFWVGMLSQQVKDQGKDIEKLKEAGEPGGVSDRLVRLEVNGENTAKAMEGVHRSLEGIQRQLANMVQGPPITRLTGEPR